MVRSRVSPLRVILAVSALLLTACSGGSGEKEKAAHPVFGAPLGQQPRQALLATQAEGTARFTQTLTFGSPEGDTVQKATGRVDFAGGRAAGSVEWTLAPDLPEEAKDELLGARLGPGRSPALTRLAVDPDSIRLRAGEADYWLDYAGSLEVFGGEAAINALRGTESAFGGTLLEVLSGVQDVRESTETLEEKGSRAYQAELTAYNALRMFSQDLRAELTSDIDPGGTKTPVTLGIRVDAEGRVTRAEADLSALLDRKDGALAGMTGLRAVLTVSGHGDSAPAMPAPTERTLDAKDAVTAIGDLEEGACADLTTGNRTPGTVVAVPCDRPHDVRVFAHPRLDTAYPGDEEAESAVEERCTGEYRPLPGAWKREAAEDDLFWYTWPAEKDWGVGGEPTATCYIVTRDPVTTRLSAV
ncbi:septum formation family protein [Streptomyces nitrosporeus]|uniref:septum formation family protein n=1 Tax=Streptomyces nitrosporeus TaxID=28894 RepID=UPI00142EF01D|nr:septum formation family protein [Streptomyces nitrosporeus]